jgi:hypothetical protein
MSVGKCTKNSITGGTDMLMRNTTFAALIIAIATSFSSLAVADSSAPKWKVWTYNRSNQAFSGSVPKFVANGIATFPFPATPDTALLVTDHGSYKGVLLGNLTGKTLSATVSDSGGEFTYYGQPDACNRPADVRLYFQTKSKGSFAYTDYWWSNPVSRPLGSNTPTPMSVSLADPS